MEGTIYHLNNHRGMYSILLSNGSFVVFELLDSCELSKGDGIKGTINGHGDTMLTNTTTHENFNVYVERIGSNETDARAGCFIR